VLTNSCAAELRLDRALDARYRWPRDFPGFEATVRLSPMGDPAGSVEAGVRVPAAGSVLLIPDPGQKSGQKSGPMIQAALAALVDAPRQPSVLRACLAWPKRTERLDRGRGELIRVDDPARTTLRLSQGQSWRCIVASGSVGWPGASTSGSRPPTVGCCRRRCS
jgi:hypothetical protein